MLSFRSPRTAIREFPIPVALASLLAVFAIVQVTKADADEPAARPVAIVTRSSASLRIGATTIGCLKWGDVVRIKKRSGSWLRVASIERIRNCGRHGWIESAAINEVGSIKKAVDFFDQEIKENPENAAAYVHRGLLRLFENSFNTAMLSEADKAISLSPSESAGYVLRAIGSQCAGRTDDALRDCAQAIAVDPTSLPAFYERSAIYLGRGQYDDALQDVDRAIDLGTDDPRFFATQAYALRRKGLNDEALKAINHGLHFEPEFAPALQERCHLFLSKGDLDAAYADIDAAVRSAPKSGPYLSHRALVASFCGDYEQSNRDLRAALELAPTNEEVVLRYVNLCCGIQGARDALPVVETCARAHPKSGNLQRLRGLLLVILGREREA